MTTYREFVTADLIPCTMRKGKGGRVLWAAFSLLGDIIADAMLRAAFQGMVRSKLCCNDIVPTLGRESSLPYYPAETIADYRVRIHNRWETWDFMGGDDSVVGQLKAAGYGRNPVWFTGTEDDPVARWVHCHVANHAEIQWIAGYPSEFAVVIPTTTARRDGQRLYCGPTTMCGIETMSGTALTRQECLLISNIIRASRPTKDLCRALIFTVAGDATDNITLHPYWCPRF